MSANRRSQWVGGLWPFMATLLTLILCGTAQAQQYGQWSWEAQAGYQRRGYSNFLDDARVSGYGEQSLVLNGAVRGFIIHPAFLRFRAELDLALSRYKESGISGQDAWGFRGQFEWMPRSRYPVTLNVGHQRYDYARITEEQAIRTWRLPAWTTSVGGRLRARSGALTGLLAGADWTQIGYDNLDRNGYTARAFADWARRGRRGRFQPHARLDWRADDYAVTAYSTQSVTLGYDHFADVAADWRWQMGFSGIWQEFDFEARSSSYASLRTLHNVRQQISPGELLEFSYDGGLYLDGSNSQGHRLGARRMWRVGRGGSLGPYASLGLQRRDGDASTIPAAGLTTAWQGRYRAVDVNAGGSLGYQAVLSGSGDGASSQLAYTLNAGLGHGVDLHKTLTVAIARNRQRIAGEAPVDDVPELTPLLSGVGIQDTFRTRLELSKRWRGLSGTAYGEYSLSSPAGIFEKVLPDSRTFTGTFQVAGQRFSLTTNMGSTQLSGISQGTVQFVRASVGLRPLRLVTLSGSFAKDFRDLERAPRVDGRRLEASGAVQVGQFVARALFFEATEQSLGRDERRNKGFTFNLTRRFSGWLPFATGGLGRGMVR